jgi:hypothetical protein
MNFIYCFLRRRGENLQVEFDHMFLHKKHSFVLWNGVLGKLCCILLSENRVVVDSQTGCMLLLVDFVQITSHHITSHMSHNLQCNLAVMHMEADKMLCCAVVKKHDGHDMTIVWVNTGRVKMKRYTIFYSHLILYMAHRAFGDNISLL